MKEIVLTTINAKWIHPSLALRLLKANLASLENNCEIIEFALRQPLAEKLETLLAARPRILGMSVSIWNHTAALQLLEELEKVWDAAKPVVVLGGPEASHLPPEAEIFKYADYVIRGEGEIAFRKLCENILKDGQPPAPGAAKFIDAENVDVAKIKSAYHLYADEGLSPASMKQASLKQTFFAKKLIYVEASRGCPYNCEFCLSAATSAVREFPLEPFLEQMEQLIRLGVKTFKFLDRSFNININRAVRICEFFLEKIKERESPLVVHFEMVPSLFPPELLEVLSRFPPGSLRLEIGIQTLNAEVSSRISRPSNPEKELETLRCLCEKTNAIIHADLIAGLPGEDFASFGKGFDLLRTALNDSKNEIQPGILKLLPGAIISRHNENFAMKYNPAPPYEIEKTSAMSADDLGRIKNFARFWEIIVNRKLFSFNGEKQIFDNFMALSDSLFIHFGRNWGIDKQELLEAVKDRVGL